MSGEREIEIIDRIDAGRLPDLLALFATAWWTSERDEASVERMLAGTDVVVGVVDARSDRVVGFARAITDGAFIAVVLDVIVDPAARGRGYGRRLLVELLARPELDRVESVELVCQPELVEFYRRFGFSGDVGRSLLLRRTRNPLLAG